MKFAKEIDLSERKNPVYFLEKIPKNTKKSEKNSNPVRSLGFN